MIKENKIAYFIETLENSNAKTMYNTSQEQMPTWLLKCCAIFRLQNIMSIINDSFRVCMFPQILCQAVYFTVNQKVHP